MGDPGAEGFHFVLDGWTDPGVAAQLVSTGMRRKAYIFKRQANAALIEAAVHLAKLKWLPSLGSRRLYGGANEPLDFEEVEAGGSFAATIGRRYTVTAKIYDIKAPQDQATSSAAAAPPGDTVIYMTVLAIDSIPIEGGSFEEFMSPAAEKKRRRGRRNC